MLGPRPRLPLEKEDPQHAQAARREARGTPDAPVPLLVGRPFGDREGGQRLALLLEPALAADRAEIGEQALPEHDEVPDVLGGVVLLRGESGRRAQSVFCCDRTG